MQTERYMANMGNPGPRAGFGLESLDGIDGHANGISLERHQVVAALNPASGRAAGGAVQSR